MSVRKAGTSASTIVGDGLSVSPNSCDALQLKMYMVNGEYISLWSIVKLISLWIEFFGSVSKKFNPGWKGKNYTLIFGKRITASLVWSTIFKYNMNRIFAKASTMEHF